MDGANTLLELTFSYDAAGQLTEASDPAATYEYVYDALGRLLSETQDLAGLTPDIELQRTYDAGSRQTELQAIVGGTADLKNTFTHDALSRVTGVTQQGTSGGNAVAVKRVDFAYNASGQFSTISRFADIAGMNAVAASTFAYDGIGRLASLFHEQGTTTLAGYDYTYDAASRITEIDSFLDGLSTFSYDTTNQLTGADHAGQTDETYSYDDNGNRDMSGHVVGTNNRLTSEGTYDYEYDNEGNRTAKETIATGEREEYEWDHRNRLTKITFKNSVGTVIKTVDQTYDAFDRWIKRSIDPDGATGSAAAIDTIFAYDNLNILFEFDGSSASDLTDRYLWNPAAVDQVLATESVSSLSSAGDVLWPLTDHLGTPRDIADWNESTGVTTVVNHRDYDTFGKLLSESNATFSILIGFTGRPFDESTGLNNHWKRWYVLSSGVWASEDPIGFAAEDSNIYRYAGNRSTTFADSNGLQGHHRIPSETWNETGFDPSVFAIWDGPDARIFQPEGTGHNYTAHGAQRGYTAHVTALLREDLKAYVCANGKNGALTLDQQEEFAKAFLKKIQSMPKDTYIGGFNDAVKRGGIDEVKKWWTATGSKIGGPKLGTAVSITGTLKAKGGASVKVGGRIGGGAMSVINGMDTVEMAHDALIAAHSPSGKCEYHTYYFKDSHGTYHYEQIGTGVHYRGTEAVYDSGSKDGERVPVTWWWAKVRMFYKRFADPPPPSRIPPMA
jgi:RHS repeat-associated protein